MHDPDYLEYIQQFLTPELASRFDEVLEQRTRSITVVLENIWHAHNAAACLRNCDAFGVQDVHLIEDGDEYQSRRTIDVGAARWLTLHQHPKSTSSTRDCVQNLREQGYRIVATTLSEDAFSPATLPIAPKTAILFGSEKPGLSEQALELADEQLVIPMYGFVQSLNVSVAVALCLQPIMERLRSDRGDWGLSDDEKAELRREWLHRSVNHRYPRIVEQYWRDRRAAESSPRK